MLLRRRPSRLASLSASFVIGYFCSAVNAKTTTDEDNCRRGGKGGAASGSCAATPESPVHPPVLSRNATEFWADMKKRGLQLRLKRSTVAEKATGKKGSTSNRTAMVLSEDVYYGRPIIKFPRRAMLSIETAFDKGLKGELTRFLYEDMALERKYNRSGEDASHLLSLAYPLIAENRAPDSVFRAWLDAARDTRLFVLELDSRQRRILTGTTVEGSYEEMERNRDMILHTAPNFTFFHQQPVTVREASWALAVIMRHARVVHPHQDVRETREPRMYLVPFVQLLDVQLHPESAIGIAFQEEMIIDGSKEEEMVLQIARRDMPKNEEVFLWPGRLSNSEMLVRHGLMFPHNPVGIGRNVSQPPNWGDNPKSKIRTEYDKYNCSSLQSFELRFSPSGTPMRTFVKCYRVSWFLTNGWYSPAYTGRVRELEKWPPPEKYAKDDWLAWTQADAEVNRVVLDYCQSMRQRLRDTMDSATADEFRGSTNPTDRLLWKMRAEESRTFKECEMAAKTTRSNKL